MRCAVVTFPIPKTWEEVFRCAVAMHDMRRRIALLFLIAIRGVTALPAPDVASCDPLGPRKDCGKSKKLSVHSFGGLVKINCQSFRGHKIPA